MNNREAYKKNVLKFTCYGHDQRPGRYAYGDCKHPCNARPGCEYQAGIVSITEKLPYLPHVTLSHVTSSHFNLPNLI